MKPPPFAYEAPQSLEEALGTLARLIAAGREVKLLAGGQSLVPILNMRLAEPEVIVDLNGLEPELGYVRVDGGELCVGALVRHARLEAEPLVRRHVPVLGELEAFVGHQAIRTRGTVGGSLAHADPSAELPLAAVALGAQIVLRGPGGERRVAARDFFVTYLTADVLPDEVLVEARFPVAPARSGQAVEEYARRHGDFALVAVVASVALAEDGAVATARLTVGGVGGTPADLSDLAHPLVGERNPDRAIRDAGDAVRDGLEPDGDVHASAAYRKELAGALSQRALGKALARAREAAAAAPAG